jgi:hypothetical protein
LAQSGDLLPKSRFHPESTKNTATETAAAMRPSSNNGKAIMSKKTIIAMRDADPGWD